MREFQNRAAQGDEWIVGREHFNGRRLGPLAVEHHDVIVAGFRMRDDDASADCGHEPIMFGVGIYEVRRQREYTPEGFRRVED
jgi:hypothetical protein